MYLFFFSDQNRRNVLGQRKMIEFNFRYSKLISSIFLEFEIIISGSWRCKNLITYFESNIKTLILKVDFVCG